MRSLEESESHKHKNGGCQGLGVKCLMWTEFRFGKMREFWRRMVVMAACECSQCHPAVP